METETRKHCELIEKFYEDLQTNPPYHDIMLVRGGKHTRGGLGIIRPDEAYALLNQLQTAIEFFDDWDKIDEGQNYEILEKNGVRVRYTWNVPVFIAYAPEITKFNSWERERFELIEKVK